MTAADWCQPGVTAYVIGRRWNPTIREYEHDYEQVTIERTTATQAILADGRRFIKGGHQVGVYDVDLVAPDDKRLRYAMSSPETQAAMRQVRRDCRAWQDTETAVDARALIAALEAWIAHQEAE